MSLDSRTDWPPSSHVWRGGRIKRTCKAAAARLRRREEPVVIVRALAELAECRALDARDQAEEREDYFLSLEWGLS